MAVKAQTRGAQRLAAAFETVEQLPALRESRDRVLAAGLGNGVAPEMMIEAVGTDPGLAIAVIRRANQQINGAGPAMSVNEAIARIGAQTVNEIAVSIETFDFLDEGSGPAAALERFQYSRARHAARRRRRRPARRDARARSTGADRADPRHRQVRDRQAARRRAEPRRWRANAGGPAARRAARVRHRPRAGRRRARPALGAAEQDDQRDRAPPRRRRRRDRGARQPRRHARPPRAGRVDLRPQASHGRRALRPAAVRPRGPGLRPAPPARPRQHSDRAIAALGPRDGGPALSPRARSTSRSPSTWNSQ